MAVGVEELRRPSQPEAAGGRRPRCADGSLYCGWTTDVERHLVAHRNGTASRYTRSRRPVELAAIIPVVDRCAALREEARIKRLPRSAKLRLTDRRVDPG